MRKQILPVGLALEIIVVNNGSTDDTSSLLVELPVLIINEMKPGPSAARNAGVKASQGSVILFLDADTRPVGTKLILEHLSILYSKDKIGISGGAITPDPEQVSLIAFAENATGLFNWHDGLSEKFFTFQPTGNMAFKRELFDQIGPLNEELFWLEDFEWNTRVLQAGYTIFFNPRAGVYIRGRESFFEVIKKFYTWGLNIRIVYVKGRLDQPWIFKNHRFLFCLNVPFRILNETYVTIKRWIWTCPIKTLLLTPLFLSFRIAWGIGIAVGTIRYAHIWKQDETL